jgi:cation diffusion facilitator family transporter
LYALTLNGKEHLKQTGANAMNATKVSVLNTILNLILAAGKLAAGLLFGSTALISDAADNVSDAVMSTVALFGIQMGQKPADADHKYGHERLECIFGISMSVVMFLMGAWVVWQAATRLLSGEIGSITAPEMPALFIAAIAGVIKLIMYFWTSNAAKRFASVTLKASALNYRSDVIASAAIFIGVFGAELGAEWLDPAVGLLRSLLIFKSAAEVFRDAAGRMTDRAADTETEEALKAFVLAFPGVLALDDLKTRMFNSQIYVDLEIAADGSQTLTEAHQIADGLHDSLERSFPQIKHCTIHVNPG